MNERKEKIARNVTLLLFGLISIILMLNHAPWRDEGRAWLISDSVNGVFSLFHALRYEGTPYLWHFLMYLLQKAGVPYTGMFILHFIIIFSAAYILLKYAPFKFYQKVLFIFGYFMLFEYNIIARNYALSVLLIFSLAAVYAKRFERPVLYSILLFFFVNSNSHSLALGIVLTGFYIYESITLKKTGVKTILPGLVIMTAGIGFAYIQLMPPSDLLGRLKEWDFSLTLRHFAQAPHSLVSSFLPVPVPTLHFWNTRLVYYPLEFRSIIGVPVFLLLVFMLYRKPKMLVLYLLLSGALFSLFIFKHPGSTRHHGVLFLAFIFVSWISVYYDSPRKKGQKVEVQNNLRRNILTGILAVQVLAMPVVLNYLLKYDFSGGKKAAQILKENDALGESTLIFVYPSITAEAILPYTDKNLKIYSPELEKFVRYTTLNIKYGAFQSGGTAGIMEKVQAAAKDKGYKKIILILNEKPVDSNFDKEYRLLGETGEEVVKDERFYIYEKK